MATPLTDAINALTTYANSVTGESDTTLSDAVYSLAEGYGQGGTQKVVTSVLLNSSSGDANIADVADGSYDLAHTDGFLIIRASGSTAPSTGSYTLNNYFVPYKNKAELSSNYKRYNYKNGTKEPNSFAPFETNGSVSYTMIQNGKLSVASPTSSFMGGTGTKITVIDIEMDWSIYGIN